MISTAILREVLPRHKKLRMSGLGRMSAKGGEERLVKDRVSARLRTLRPMRPIVAT